MFRKQLTILCKAQIASYEVAEMVAKEIKSHTLTKLIFFSVTRCWETKQRYKQNSSIHRYHL